MFSHPGFYCLVAEVERKIVGSNCLDERSAIAGVGPITIDPGLQNRAIGRQLMQAVMERAHDQHFAGVRLIQSAFHNRSLSLYAKLGFVVREPIAVMNGKAIGQTPSGYRFRPAELRDLEICNGLCHQVHGHDRAEELRDGIEHGIARVIEFNGRVVGCASAVGFFGFALAESNRDLRALLSSAEQFLGPGILVPTRNAELFRWCLEQGLRVVEPMTLMTMGLYNEPVGAYLPSVLY